MPEVKAEKCWTSWKYCAVKKGTEMMTNPRRKVKVAERGARRTAATGTK